MLRVAVHLGDFFLSNKTYTTWALHFFLHIPMYISGTDDGSWSGSASDNTLLYDPQLVGGFKNRQLGKIKSVMAALEI